MQSVPVMLNGNHERPCGKIWLTDDLMQAIVRGAFFELSAHIYHALDEEPKVVAFDLVSQVAHAKSEPNASDN